MIAKKQKIINLSGEYKGIQQVTNTGVRHRASGARLQALGEKRGKKEGRG